MTLAVRKAACPDPVALSRQAAEGPNPETLRHLHECPRCAAEWESMNSLATLSRELPWGEGHERDPRGVRIALLATVEQRPPRRHPWRRDARLPWLAAAALAASLVLVAWPRLWHRLSPVTGPTPPVAANAEAAPSQPRFHTTVKAGTGARFAHTGSRKDEVIALAHGTLSLSVSHLGQGERCRVRTDDAEVEVRGTVFEVKADHGRLSAVAVTEGRVEVRPSGRPTVVLVPGQSWSSASAEVTPPAGTARAVPAKRALLPHVRPAKPAVTLAPAQVRPGRSVASAEQAPPAETRNAPADSNVRAPADAEAAFARGWRALRQGNHAEAVVELERALALAPKGSIAEDAIFWRAVALARAGMKDRAATAHAQFLKRFPQSPRAGESAALLGWLLLESGQLDAAGEYFEQALRDPLPDVRRSATLGLSQARRRR